MVKKARLACVNHPFADELVGDPEPKPIFRFQISMLQENNLKMKTEIQEEKTGEVLSLQILLPEVIAQDKIEKHLLPDVVLPSNSACFYPAVHSFLYFFY